VKAVDRWESEELAAMVKEFIADAADISTDRVGLDDSIYTTLGVDSLGAVSIFVNIAYTFGVEQPGDDEEYARLDTCRKIVDYVLASG